MRIDRGLAGAGARLLSRLRPAERQAADAAAREGSLQLMPDERRVALVTLLGVEPDAVPPILDATAATLARYDRIVYLTDDPDFSRLRRRRATFEYLPSLAEMATRGAGLPWGRYLEEKRSMLVAKWAPTQEIAYGLSFGDFIAAADAAATERPGAAEF